MKQLTNKIKELCKSRSLQWANEQAEKLMSCRSSKSFSEEPYIIVLSLSLDMYINMLL